VTTLCLVRHGTTDAVGSWLSGRMPGIPLNREGTEQAATLGAFFASAPLAAVYSSPLERALQTASAIALSHGLPVQQRADLTDIDFGDWTGKSLSELRDDPAFRRFNQQRALAGPLGNDRAIRARDKAAKGLGGADRFLPGVRRVDRLPLAALSGVGRARRDRLPHQAERHQLLAGLHCGCARGRPRRLAVLLDRRAAGAAGRAYMAAVAPPGAAAARRALYEAVGHGGHLHRAVLRAAARRGTARRRHPGDAVLALPGRQLHLGPGVGVGVVAARRRGGDSLLWRSNGLPRRWRWLVASSDTRIPSR